MGAEAVEFLLSLHNEEMSKAIIAETSIESSLFLEIDIAPDSTIEHLSSLAVCMYENLDKIDNDLAENNYIEELDVASSIQKLDDISLDSDSFIIPNLDVHDNSTPSDEIVDINLATELEVMQQEKVKLASNEKTHENDFDISKRNNVQVDKSASLKDMNKRISFKSTRIATTNKSGTKRKKRRERAKVVLAVNNLAVLKQFLKDEIM